MKRNLFFRMLARLRVGRKLLLIYLLDLSAVVFISGILIHEKYIAIDFSDKEIVGNAYLHTVRDTLVDVAFIGAGKRLSPSALRQDAERLAVAERQYGAQMQSAALNERVRDTLDALAAQPQPTSAAVTDALSACRELITRVGNQSNLILDPDLDSYYAMSLSILRYPALLDAIDGIGRQLHDTPLSPSKAEEMRTRYLVLEGQLDAVLQGLKSDFAEATAANHRLTVSLAPSVGKMLEAIETYREVARITVDSGASVEPSLLLRADAAQQVVVERARDSWHETGADLSDLLRARVRGLFSRMWLHLGTALFLLCGILVMVYFVAQQISRPLRQLARVMDTVRRTGDHSLRASWPSQDEIGQLVIGFNEMLQQLDHERDVQKELAATARASAAQHALVEATPVPMVVTAIPGHEILHANKPALYWLNECESDPWARGLDSAVRARFFQQLSDREAVNEFEVRWRATAEPTWAMLSARRLVFQGRDAVLTAFTPINQIKLMEQRLELWAKVFEASSEAILILDHDYRLLTANPAFYRATGYGADDVLRKQPDFVSVGQAGASTGSSVAAAVGRSSNWHGEAQVRRPHSGEYPAWLIVSAVRDKRGNVSHYICTLIDVTERKRSEARIQFLAEHDVLTELPNRALFSKRLDDELHKSERSGDCVAVLFIDLDRFKNINDSLGHHVGDGLLRSVSRRLLAAVRTADTVSRLGGDEFTVVLSGLSDAADAAQVINERLIALLREPHQIGGMTLQVSCSMGVAMYPADGRDISTLMQNADAAMYQAKADGRNLVRFFSPDMAERARTRLSLETCLRSAIERNELSLAFQPCLDARTGALASVEGLLRWDSPELGSVAPSRFIHIAEETGLIIPIGAWVINEACRQIAQWRDEDLMNVTVSINLSAIQLRDADVVETLRRSLVEHGVEPGLLELEITETVLMDSAENYLDAITSLRSLGVKLSLDDFGTGYSSLSYLNRFPLDRLKIDRAFVHDMLDAPADLAVIKSIIELGHELGLRVVAEGVESEREAQILRSIGCDELQGFLFARPMEPSQLWAWADEQKVA
jgi:diguanylate cyclase (GGDEF)-like protein/PAS domain S-box-containing protein